VPSLANNFRFRIVGLYAETQLSREEFDLMFRNHMRMYEEARRKYGAEAAFPHTYEKISVLGRKPLN